ncbi:ice-structuring glycoprotein-like [Brachypodium distachyon]|uniref:ice-structuring glycoprotein-like n=1 Tax=Brachypodium distachyon TaxID=15368 RepID=UPI00052FE553|nr:ice-structuring glycoprotein-like [Brachypodium distachyon]|eukprot:XP_010229843.1 ice-structuring glycoprotein-like [Brachypodium distachyon]
MDDTPSRALRVPRPAPREKKVLEESGGESETSWPSLRSRDDEAGQAAASPKVVPVDDDDEDSDNSPLIVRRSRAYAAAAAISSGATAASSPLAISAPAAAASPEAAAVSGAPACTSAGTTSAGAAGASAATTAPAAAASTAVAAAPGASADAPSGTIRVPAMASAATTAGDAPAVSPGSAPDTVAASPSTPATLRVAATPPAPTVSPAWGVFRGFALQRHPPRTNSPASSSKRGRSDSPPVTPNKRARTDAGGGADPTDTGARGAVIMPAGDPAPTGAGPVTASGNSPAAGLLEALAGTGEAAEAPLASRPAVQGQNAPVSRADATMVDLDSDVEIQGVVEDSASAPAPGPVAPATAAAVATVTTETGLGDAPGVADAAGADSPAAQQGLRVKLEVQVKSTEDAVGAAAWHEIQLGSVKNRAAKLETELAAVREELAKAGNDIADKTAELAVLEDNLRKAKKPTHDGRLHHGTLIGQWQLETEKLLKITQALRDFLP